MSAVLAAVPDVACRDCWEGFGWDSSPDPDRCLRCAEVHAWHQGAALITDITDQAPRLSAGRDPKGA